MKYSIFLLVTTLILPATLNANPTTLITLDTLKAFPTAEGAGATASGGRGGKVIYVTNRDSSGDGSLHDALKDAAMPPATNPRTIVFAIGGRFDVSDGIFLGYLKAKKQGGSDRGENIYNDFTLAGQTASDKGGVHLATEGSLRAKGAPELGVYGQENMILRYFDTRYNWEWYVEYNEMGKQPSIRFTNSSDFIIDHMTSGWSSYGLIATNDNHNYYYDKTVDNISVQRCLFHENIIDPTTSKPQKNHNVGLLLGVAQSNNSSEDWNKVGTFSIHKNAFIGVSHRFPNMAGGDNAKLNFINNFIHGFNGGGVKRLGRTAGNTHHDFINNTYQLTRYSPATGFNSGNMMALDYLNFLPKGYPANTVSPNFYIDGNLFLSNTGERLDITDSVQNSNGRDMLFTWVPDDQTDMPRLELRDSPNPSSDIGVSILSAEGLKENILNNVGGNIRFANDGSTYVDNPIDAEYIRWAVQNDAPATLTESLGDGGVGDRDRFIHPQYNTEEAVDLDDYDWDRDGMPDAWEEKHHLNPNSVIDDDLASNENNLVREDRDWLFGENDQYLVRNTAGYTNLEMYLADVAGDFHMLAQSEGTPIAPAQDSLGLSNFPSVVIAGETATAEIEYSAAGERVIKIFLQNAETGVTITSERINLEAGSG